MNILITGVTKGIGRDIALEFIRKGHKVFGVGRSKEKLIELEKEYPKNFYSLNFDVSTEEEIDNLYEKIKSLGIKINVLVNNAGVGYIGKFSSCSWEENKDILNLNIKSLTYMTYKFLNNFCESEAKGIINVSSTGAFQSGGPLISVYYASKSYVKSFSNALSEELRDKNIKVMCVCPGPTKTNFKGMEEAKGFYIMKSKDVAKIIVDDFFRGKEICIPGIFNKFLIFIGRFIPRRIELRLIKNIQNKK